MIVKPVPIAWHPGLSVFASEPFLQAVGDNYGWLGGFDEFDNLQCVLPYTMITKSIFRMVRFRVETIHIGQGIDVDAEKAFLNGVTAHFKSMGADIIIPATTNTIFRTFPDGAIAAPYGSYVIDLNQTEELLWQNIDRITRQNIKSAQKNSVTVQRRIEPLDEAYRLIVETFRRSKLPFMGYEAFRRYADGLTGQMEIMIASCQGVAQSYVLFAFSNYCAYAVYAGNIADMCQGANKLLYWEAIRYFKKIGVQKYDFVGARINPEKGTKQSGINSLKKRFGAKLVQGYMWKYKIRPVKSLAYSIAVRLLRGGDIVDAECHKIESI